MNNPFSCSYATFTDDMLFQRHADADPTILGSPANSVDIIGFCGGLLPAAVALAAHDTSQLFALGREIVSISFRLACEVAQRKRLIDATPESWGKTYVGLPKDQVQNILDKFHESQVRGHISSSSFTRNHNKPWLMCNTEHSEVPQDHHRGYCTGLADTNRAAIVDGRVDIMVPGNPGCGGYQDRCGRPDAQLLVP
jgi:hypothetical protein